MKKNKGTTLQIASFESEGFLSGLGIAKNDFILRTHTNLAWCGKEEQNKNIQLFVEFVDSLVDAGFDVEEWDVLKPKTLEQIQS